MEGILGRTGRIDAVVACAGWGLAGAVEQTVDRGRPRPTRDQLLGCGARRRRGACRSCVPKVPGGWSSSARSAGSSRSPSRPSTARASSPWRGTARPSRTRWRPSGSRSRSSSRATSAPSSLRTAVAPPHPWRRPYREAATRAVTKMAEDEAKGRLTRRGRRGGGTGARCASSAATRLGREDGRASRDPRQATHALPRLRAGGKEQPRRLTEPHDDRDSHPPDPGATMTNLFGPLGLRRRAVRPPDRRHLCDGRGERPLLDGEGVRDGGAARRCTAARLRDGQVHQPKRARRLRGDLPRGRADHGPREPSPLPHPRPHRGRADSLRGARTDAAGCGSGSRRTTANRSPSTGCSRPRCRPTWRTARCSERPSATGSAPTSSATTRWESPRAGSPSTGRATSSTPMSGRRPATTPGVSATTSAMPPTDVDPFDPRIGDGLLDDLVAGAHDRSRRHPLGVCSCTSSMPRASDGSSTRSWVRSSTPTGGSSGWRRSGPSSPTTRRTAGCSAARCRATLEDGSPRRFRLEVPTATGFHLGAGLYFGWQGHHHGEWRGELHVDGERLDDCSEPVARPRAPPAPRHRRRRPRPRHRRRGTRQLPADDHRRPCRPGAWRRLLVLVSSRRAPASLTSEG